MTKVKREESHVQRWKEKGGEIQLKSYILLHINPSIYNRFAYFSFFAFHHNMTIILVKTKVIFKSSAVVAKFSETRNEGPLLHISCCYNSNIMLAVII